MGKKCEYRVWWEDLREEKLEDTGVGGAVLLKFI
jgi:hypothetical protein